MTPERWRRVSELYHAASDLDRSERTAFLDAACAGDGELHREVQSLLDQGSSESTGMLDHPAEMRDMTVLPPGETLGQYRIVEHLGEGGMGTVYRAIDAKLGRSVALKLLRPEMLGDLVALARFEREARTLASLNHPNIATIHGFEEHKGVHFLVLEYVPGETLAERLRRGPLALREALLVSKCIAEALETAHARGIIHRDLKPANIKITESGQVKVLDFGLAKSLSREGAEKGSATTLTDLTRSMMVVGTPAYMSPEQVRGAAALDTRTDIWSFGCVLYESLAGRRPFVGSAAAEIFAAVLTREPDWSALPSTVPDRLTTLLERCLRKESTARLRDLGEARIELQDLLASPSGAQPSRKLFPVRKKKTLGESSSRNARHRLRLPAALAAALLLLGSAGYWQLIRNDYFWKNPLDGAQFTKLTDWPGIELDASISPDGKFAAFLSNRDGIFDAYVTQLGSGDFHNLTGGKSSALLHEMARTTGFNADSTQVWIRTPALTLERINIFTGPPSLSLVPTMGGPLRPFLGPSTLNPVWTTDGLHLAFHHSDLGDPIMVAAPDGRGERQIIRGRPGEHEHYLTWSPDQRWIYFVRCWRTTEADIWRVPVRGGPAEQITHHHSYVAYPVLLNNRTLIYRASKEDGSGWVLYAMDLNHRIAHQVSEGVEEYQSVAASADGHRLVVTTSNPVANLWRIPITGGIAEETAAERLPIPDAYASFGQYADGGVLYVSGKGGAGGLRKWMNGTVTTPWPASNGRIPYGASLSPDKQRLAFAVRQDGRNVLQVSNADGTNAHGISAQLDVLTTPSWSPDNKWITTSADSGDGPRVYKVPVDGGDAVRLTDTVTFNSVWSPGADRIVFYDGNVGGATFPLRSISSSRGAMPMPNISYRGDWQGYRFMPDGKDIVVLQGQFRAMDFWLLNLETGAKRRLTNLKPGYSIRNLDISPDGKEILFDRLQENSDITLINRK